MAVLTDFTKKDKNPVMKTTTGFLSRTLTIPLCQENDFECTPVVKEGDYIKEGQVIAEVSRDVYGTKSFGVAKIHSPIPGKLICIKNCNYPNGKQGKAIEILLSGSFTFIGKKQNTFDWNSYSPAMLLRTISESGVVNTFSNTYCSSLELEVNKIRDEENKKLVVRLFDEDPSCETDSILTRSEIEKIATGIFITAKTSDVSEIVVAYSNNTKLPAIFDLFQKELFGYFPITYIEMKSKFYPAGGKRELISAYKKQKKLTALKTKIQSSCIFTDANTMIHVYNAVVLNIPVETVNVFVNGDCLQSKALLKVSIGTSFRDIAKQCGGFVKDLGKIIVNGQINGVSINSLDTPVTKYVKSISFISEKDRTDRSVGICLRCGRCRTVCKSNLCPDVIYAKVIEGATVDSVYDDSVQLCTECGVCSAYCPSKLPLTQVIKLLKADK